QAAEIAARSEGIDLAGRIRASVPASLANLYIMPHLPDFLHAYPNLSLELVLDNGDLNLIEQGVDIAIRVGPLRNSNMTARKLATSDRLVVGSSDYFERVGIPRTPSELKLNDAITCTQDAYGDVWPFHRESQELVIRTSSRLRVGGCEGVRAAVLSGAGF